MDHYWNGYHSMPSFGFNDTPILILRWHKDFLCVYPHKQNSMANRKKWGSSSIRSMYSRKWRVRKTKWHEVEVQVTLASLLNLIPCLARILYHSSLSFWPLLLGSLPPSLDRPLNTTYRQTAVDHNWTYPQDWVNRWTYVVAALNVKRGAIFRHLGS